MQRIGGETMVLYADLRERLEVFEAMRGIAHLQGDFTRKTVKGKVYHYFRRPYRASPSIRRFNNPFIRSL